MPYGKEELGQWFNILAQQNQDQLTVIWSLRSFQKFYRDAPVDYFSYLLGHEGDGSLSQVLKEEGLANSLEADVEHEMRVMTTFIIQVDLTERGYKEKERVVEYIYAYLKMLRKEGINHRVF